MDIHITEYKVLVDKLRELRTGIIAVDGVCEEARQALAKALSLKFGISVADTGPAMKEAGKSAKNCPVIVEGVVLLEALKKAGLQAAVSVYVIPAPDSPSRHLFDGIVSRGYDEVMEELKVRPDDRHTVDYHYTFHPIIHADFLIQGQKTY